MIFSYLNTDLIFKTMKKLILLSFIVGFSLTTFAQSGYQTKVFEWTGNFNVAAVRYDTVIQYTGPEEAGGLNCNCSFEFSGLNRDSSSVKMGGSMITLNTTGKIYYAFVPFSDSLFLRKALYKNYYHSSNGIKTSYVANYQKDPYYNLKPAFQWRTLGRVSTGIFYYKCIFSRK